MNEPLAKISNIDWFDVIALEKLDGSMICPLFLSSKDANEQTQILWMTKKSTNKDVDEYVSTRPQYEKLARDFPEWSCIFEWCSPKNRIVVPYKQDCLILTSIRHMQTGRYKLYDEVCEIANKYEIPCVDLFPLQPVFTKENMEVERETFWKKLYLLENVEGCVLVSKSKGYPVCKLKSDWYVNIHRSCDQIANGKAYPWKCVIEETLDDVYPRLTNDLRERLEKFNDAVKKRIQERANEIVAFVEEFYETLHVTEIDNEKFVAPLYSAFVEKKIEKYDRPLYYMMRLQKNDKQPFDVLHKFLKKRVGDVAWLEKFLNIDYEKF